MRLFLTSTAIIFFLNPVFGQQASGGQSFVGGQQKQNKYISVGVGINANNYFGDLNSFSAGNLFKSRRFKPGIALLVEKRISPHGAIAANFSWNRISADDYYNADPAKEIASYTRNLSFRNDLLELAATFRYFLKKNEYTYVERPVFSPYLFAGAGLFYNNPRARIPEFKIDGSRFENAGQWQPLRELGTEGQKSEGSDMKQYSIFQPVVPLGLGAEIKIDNNFSVNLELSYRYIFSDYLDDVGGNYVDLGSLNSDLAKVFSDRSREINSSNGRNPRNFSLIYQYTNEKTYISKYDGYQYQVLDGYGEEKMKRGDDVKRDFYITAGIRLTYVLSGKKEKRKDAF